MTGVAQLRPTVIVTAAPRTFRVSVFGGRTQLDIELPADVPMADILPELAELISSRDIKVEETEEILETKRDRWVLTRISTGTTVEADQTLAEAGSHDGDLLSLTAERVLPPPELFDDVVDAVARLNREGFATWGRTAARWMAFVALALTVGVLDLLLLRDSPLPERTMLGYQTIGVIVALVIASFVAQRFYGESQISTALGWAALPLVFGMTTVFAEHLPESWQPWTPSIVCLAMTVAAVLIWRVTTTGRLGFLSTAVAFGLFTIAGIAHAAFDWSASVTGPVLATAGALMSLLAGPLTRASDRRTRHRTAQVETDDDTQDPFAESGDRVSRREQQLRAAENASARVPSVEQVAVTVERSRTTKAALYLAAAVTMVVGCALGVSDDAAAWSTVVFCVVIASMMMLASARRLPLVPSAIMLAGGVTVVVATGISLRTGSTPMYDAAAIALLALAVLSIAAGIIGGRRSTRQMPQILDHLEYVAVLAVLPALAWSVGLFDAVGRL